MTERQEQDRKNYQDKAFEKAQLNLDTQVALLNDRLQHIAQDVHELKETIKNLAKDLENINNMTNRWRGGILVILAIGGFIGWLLTLGVNILKWH